MKMFNKNSKALPVGRQGFTLIELLVVIAIIGILSSVVLASLNSARKKSRDARRVADIGQIKTALELEFDKSNAYPADLATLKTNNFIPQIPTDPLGGSAYKWCKISDTDYHLGATLEENTPTGALASDSDSTSTACVSGGGAAFAGTDPVYDVKP